jgi:hypothetical protein
MPHDLCEENHEHRVEVRVQALLKAVDNDHPERTIPRDLQKLIDSLKLRKACGNVGISIESLVHDSGCTLVCAEYSYPKGYPNTNS